MYYSRDVVALFRGVAGHNVGEDEVCAVVYTFRSIGLPTLFGILSRFMQYTVRLLLTGSLWAVYMRCCIDVAGW